jgi:hypothetical protein
MPALDRRHSAPRTSNDTINLVIVSGLLFIGIVFAVGVVWLAAIGRTAPELFSHVLTTLIGGLIGYLSRESNPGSGSAVSAGPVETLNVEAQAQGPGVDTESRL